MWRFVLWLNGVGLSLHYSGSGLIESGLRISGLWELSSAQNNILWRSKTCTDILSLRWYRPLVLQTRF